VTYGTSEAFLSHFGLDAVADLPGLEELKGSGLLDGRLPPGFAVPMPSDDPALREDEDPLEPGDLDLGLAPPPERISEDLRPRSADGYPTGSFVNCGEKSGETSGSQRAWGPRCDRAALISARLVLVFAASGA
jgi:hypothetical protein